MMRLTKMQSVLVFAFFCFVFLASGFYVFTFQNIGEEEAVMNAEKLEKGVNSTSTEGTVEEETDYPRNKLNNMPCKNYDRRPFAVMIAEDAEARDLSGIAAADLVVEMPVVTGSITRMMALFVCEDPEEIGSVRSARHDFIPLALGYDAILAHWGGSYLALEELDKGAIDNLDAMVNYYSSFYRKNWIPAPHNGFTNMGRMINAASRLGYRLNNEFEGYRFATIDRTASESKTVTIGYRYPYNIEYRYYPETNSYLRWRAGKKEIDALTKEQVKVENIAVMRAVSRQIGGGYNDVDVTGSGETIVYRNGQEIKGTWEKKTDSDVLRFYDKNGEEIKFTTGKIWVEVVEPDTEVSTDN